MINMIQDIKDFHEKFGLAPTHTGGWFPLDLKKFRTGFMQEELLEYRDAKNTEEALDALVDLVYVALGTAYLQGFNFEEAWRRVHEANMKKARAVTADQSKRGSAYDIIKPEDWVAPDLSDLVP